MGIGQRLRRNFVTGFFVMVPLVVSVVAIVWVISSLLNNTIPLAVQNAILLAVNAWGVWQYLLSPKKKREIERAEELAEQAKDDVEAEKG